LFRTLDEQDGKYCSDKITLFEEEQTNFLELSKEEIIIVEGTLMAVKRTLNEQ
jgi:hypothetical protein